MGKNFIFTLNIQELFYNYSAGVMFCFVRVELNFLSLILFHLIRSLMFMSEVFQDRGGDGP